MTFLIAKNQNINSIVCSRANKVLSLLFENTPYCVLSSIEMDEDPLIYSSVEQALDDFEYDTCKLSNRVINSFKNVGSRFNERRLLGMASNSDFTIEKDGDFVSLLYIPLGIQLNFSPSSETLTGDDEFTITTLDFELVNNYETLGDNFTDDIIEGLTYFEDITGEIPESIKEKFINTCK